MSFKLFKCAICGADVSGRKSRVVEPHGRICMTHQEFIDHENKEKIEAEAAAKKLIDDKKIDQAMMNVQVMVIVEQLRMGAFVQGRDLYSFTQAMAHRLPKEIRAKVITEVQERGPLTEDEANAAFAMTAVMMSEFKDRMSKDVHQRHGLINPVAFEDFCGYKYVRFADGNVAFCDATDLNMSHKQIVDAYRHPIMPGDPISGQAVPPVSAGTIKVREGKWAITESGSITAKLNRSESDEKYIQKALGDKFVFDIEVSY